MPDVITILTGDHQKVDTLFTRFASGAADRDRRGTVDAIVRELSVHAAIEEQVLYPTVAEEVPGGQQLVDESLQEHQMVKETLAIIERLEPDSPELDELMNSLIQHVRHHVQEEEGELFPQLRAAVGAEQLDNMGEALEKARALAPTHPHPKAPATPPGNLVGGAAAGMLDKARDLAKSLTRKVRK